MSWTMKAGGIKRLTQHTSTPQRTWPQNKETVWNVVFLLSKVFLHYTAGTFNWNSVLSYISVISSCCCHNHTTQTIEGRVWSNTSKHVTVAKWWKKQLSLSCCSLSFIVASRRARPLLICLSTFILITLRIIACWHVKSMALREHDTKHSLQLSLWSSGGL